MSKLLTVCKRLSSQLLLQPMAASKTQTISIQQLFRKNNENPNRNIRPHRVSVEGNIGAGKSSVLNHFARNPTVETYPEPIEWWCNMNGYNLLDLLYKDMKTWYNVFQQYVQLTRVQVQTTPPEYSSTVQMFERSVQSSRYCFLEQAHAAGLLEHPEYDVMDEWYQWIESNTDIGIDFIVYLRTTPSVVYERMLNRARKEESKVTLNYLQELHDSHERWLLGTHSKINPNQLLVIDADQPLCDVIKQCELNSERILINVLNNNNKNEKTQ